MLHRDVEEVFAVRQKRGPAMRRIERRVDRGYQGWRASISGHARDSSVIRERGDDGAILTPGAATPKRRLANRDRRSSGDLNSLQLVVSEEGDGVAVGRPERKHRAFGFG